MFCHKPVVSLLSLSAVALLACSASSAQAGTIAYWRFEPDDAGTTTVNEFLMDSAGNNDLTNHGALQSATVPGATIYRAMGGPAGNHGSASFDGLTDDAGTDADPVLEAMRTTDPLDLTAIPDDGGLTIEWFMKNNSTSGSHMVMEHSHLSYINSHNGAFYANVFSGSELHAAQNVANDPDPNNPPAYEPTYRDRIPDAVTTSEWRHYAVIIDSSVSHSSDRVQVYVDGVKQILNAGKEDLALGDAPFLSEVLYIGARANDALLYDGLLDEIRISDEILSPDAFLTTVPEPGSLALLGLGGLALLKRRRSWR